jgi:hypothetical protein
MMFLSNVEIEELTGKKRCAAQAKVLNALGITHKRRPDGSLVVLRAHVEAVLGGKIQKPDRLALEPNWEALNEVSPAWQKQLDQRAAAKKRRNDERAARGLPPID